MPTLLAVISRAERIARWRLRAKDLRARAYVIGYISTSTRETYLELANNYEVLAEQLTTGDDHHSGTLAEHLAVVEQASRRVGC